VRDRAVALREAIYHLFSATAAGRMPRRVDVETLNKYLPRALAGPHLRAGDAPGAGFTLGWAETSDDLDGCLLPVVRSAAALLTSPELSRVGECADDRGCGYLFYDETRNRSRRWCDMGSCGNRAKARRHAGKQQDEGTPDTERASTKHDST
jgi:predicted RNA-binding Zn ribbon-like protein